MVSKYRVPISILKKAVLVGCNTVSGWDCDELTFDNVRLWCHLDWICVTTQPYNTQVTDVAPNLHFPHLHRTQIYANPRFTPDPNLHKPRFTRTHIYTAQIYTNPFSHIDSKKLKFTQPNFTQKHKFTQNFFFKFCSNYIK